MIDGIKLNYILIYLTKSLHIIFYNYSNYSLLNKILYLVNIRF